MRITQILNSGMEFLVGTKLTSTVARAQEFAQQGAPGLLSVHDSWFQLRL